MRAIALAIIIGLYGVERAVRREPSPDDAFNAILSFVFIFCLTAGL